MDMLILGVIAGFLLQPAGDLLWRMARWTYRRLRGTTGSEWKHRMTRADLEAQLARLSDDAPDGGERR